MKQVSVYIPAYNAEEFLERCLDSLARQTLLPDQILVIDDGSRDQSGKIAQRHARVTVIRHERNLGLAAARNTALQAARNELVASLDADCSADPQWLEKLVPHLDDSGVAGAGGQLTEGVQDSVADRWRCAHMVQHWGDQRLENPPFLFGCNNIFRKSALLGCGGYDETMRTNGEDADISRKLLTHGWRLVYDPRAKATHMRRDTVTSIVNTYWRWTFHGFEKPIERLRLIRILRRAVLGNVRYMFGNLAKSDLLAGRIELLPLDFYLLLYFPQRELREWYSLWRRG